MTIPLMDQSKSDPIISLLTFEEPSPHFCCNGAGAAWHFHHTEAFLPVPPRIGVVVIHGVFPQWGYSTSDRCAFASFAGRVFTAGAGDHGRGVLTHCLSDRVGGVLTLLTEPWKGSVPI